jgi:hypothetical protein
MVPLTNGSGSWRRPPKTKIRIQATLVQTYQVYDGEPLPIDGPVTAAQPPQLPPHRLRPLFWRAGTAGEHLTQGSKGEAGPLIGLREKDALGTVC